MLHDLSLLCLIYGYYTILYVKKQGSFCKIRLRFLVFFEQRKPPHEAEAFLMDSDHLIVEVNGSFVGGIPHHMGEGFPIVRGNGVTVVL